MTFCSPFLILPSIPASYCIITPPVTHNNMNETEWHAGSDRSPPTLPLFPSCSHRTGQERGSTRALFILARCPPLVCRKFGLRWLIHEQTPWDSGKGSEVLVCQTCLRCKTGSGPPGDCWENFGCVLRPGHTPRPGRGDNVAESEMGRRTLGSSFLTVRMAC